MMGTRGFNSKRGSDVGSQDEVVKIGEDRLSDVQIQGLSPRNFKNLTQKPPLIKKAKAKHRRVVTSVDLNCVKDMPKKKIRSDY